MMGNANEALLREEPLTSLELTRAAAQGDPAARRELVDLLFDRVRRTASFLSGNAADAEDLAQVALVRILSSAGTYQGESSLTRWADRVTVLTAAKELEKKTRRARLFAVKWAAPAPSAGVDEDTDARRIRSGLVAAVRRLPARNRAAIVLHYFRGYGVAEVAELVDAPINTVRGRLRAGREQLRKLVAADPLLRQWVSEQSR
jgi:RNA polymerase sigma-70 factor, ECF subfamily